MAERGYLKMNKIKKALDVLKSDCKNPLIIKDMIGVLEREFICLSEENEKLRESIQTKG